MDLNCINSYDNFKIVGKWGIDKNNLNIDGFLNYDNNGINLITNDSITDDFLINSERIDFIYGKGFIHINNNKFYVSHISLYKNYFSIDGIAGLSKVYNCKSKYIYG
ncbi:hypothetical protein DY120_00640 [Apilactobacillus micheneri]|uniref:Uncharacterized protein n=1 Tax=Apilactobacillus micheneri TaxID=1899430 RepID=A0ABY2YYV4_9LACO|nr:hypothetical protein [Apilactobacillus micheneri]TPR26237.1 hypothetical protein DY114_00640 [Apilactobacillus micheneri]TPR26991.1 hypothetical protein DY111_00640 [Apilactobacillus micheneri]TPR27849.1 hypothetical protein DY113_04415 [Apilactobacillus micheneri]TPR31754.1 hypothetical protein DY117_00640 [Apilactobacillus micheneri]TPR32158.1 hypothetical protein DY120_00640 [Apilactobacillus micheneri]